MRKSIIALTIMSCMMLSGCASVIDLTSEEENLIVEYAAHSMINAYKDSKGMLPEVDFESETTVESTEAMTEKETESEKDEQKESIPVKQETESSSESAETEEGSEGSTESTSEVSTESSTEETTEASTESTTENSTEGTTETSTEETVTAGSGSDTDLVVQALKIKGVELSVLGYSVYDRYPMEEYTFVVEPAAGQKLLVIEYDVWNSVDAESVMKVDTTDVTLRAIINGEETLPMQKTLLNTDIFNMDGTKFAPGEAKVGVLVFGIDEKLAKNIATVEVKALIKENNN